MSILVADLNHNNPIDLAKIKADGKVGGFIHKARQGTGFMDPLYRSRAAEVQAAGFELGAYDFATGDNVAEDVADFFDTVRPDARTSMWLDFEDNTKSQMSLAHALEHLDRVDQKLGRYEGIYAGNRIKTLIIGATQAQRDFLALHPFWLCEYGPVAKMVDDNHQPLPWKKWSLWQQWADGFGPSPPIVNGLERKADLSWFDGDRAALGAWWPLSAVEGADVPTAGETA
jgi:GH25 family lysozyme M1 (1,4-beta-N-acetylmuramidase)